MNLRKNHSIYNESGTSLLMATVMIVIIGLSGFNIVDLFAKGSGVSSTSNLSSMANVGAMAGIEAALHRLKNGLNPAQTITIDNAEVTITADPVMSSITAESLVDNGGDEDAKRLYQVNAVFSKDNLVFDITNSFISGNNLVGLSLDKSLDKIDIIDKITVSWNRSQCAKAITCEGHDETHLPCDDDDLSPSDLEALNECSVLTTVLEMDEIIFEGATLFSVASDTPEDATEMESGDQTDVVDANLADITDYIFDSIGFDDPIDEGTWFTVEIEFADLSTIEERFQVYTALEDYETPTDVVEGVGGDFDEDGGVVTVSASDDYRLNVEVIAKELTCGTGGPNVNIRVDISVNGVYSTAFGGAPVSVGQTDYRDNLSQEKDYIIRGRASMPSCGGYSQTRLSTGTLVHSLVDGDAIPDTWSWEGFGGQQSVREILEPYIDESGLIDLPTNQVLMCFEFNSTVGGDENADYQDLVLLIDVDRL